MGEFAKADMFSGEDAYDEYLNLKETEGINSKFVLFGSDNMIMLTNSGSFFIAYILIIVAFIFYVIIYRMAVRFA
jgi:hypothetical protein